MPRNVLKCYGKTRLQLSSLPLKIVKGFSFALVLWLLPVLFCTPSSPRLWVRSTSFTRIYLCLVSSLVTVQHIQSIISQCFQSCFFIFPGFLFILFYSVHLIHLFFLTLRIYPAAHFIYWLSFIHSFLWILSHHFCVFLHLGPFPVLEKYYINSTYFKTYCGPWFFALRKTLSILINQSINSKRTIQLPDSLWLRLYIYYS